MENEILNYLTPDKVVLVPLDKKYKHGYTGVTLRYITYSVLKAKYKKRDVAEMLLKLHKEGKIRSLFCPDVEEYVFMSKKCAYWNFNREDGTAYTKKYNLHTYLEKFINI